MHHIYLKLKNITDFLSHSYNMLTFLALLVDGNLSISR